MTTKRKCPRCQQPCRYKVRGLWHCPTCGIAFAGETAQPDLWTDGSKGNIIRTPLIEITPGRPVTPPVPPGFETVEMSSDFWQTLKAGWHKR